MENGKLRKINPLIVFYERKSAHFVVLHDNIGPQLNKIYFNPFDPPKRIKTLKKSNPLIIPLDMTHSYHKHVYMWLQKKHFTQKNNFGSFFDCLLPQKG